MQAKKDLTPERGNMFKVYLAQKPLVYSCYCAAQRNFSDRAKALIAFFYAMFCSAKYMRFRKNSPLAIYLHINEEKRILSLRSLLDSLGFGILSWRMSSASRIFSFIYFAAFFSLRPHLLGKTFRLLGKTLHGKPLFVGMRIAETLFTYIYLSRRFKAKRPSLLLVSTDGNPHGCAIMGIAKRMGISLVYASHGAVSSSPVQIECDLALFYGKKSLDGYMAKDSRFGNTGFYGFQEVYKPIQAKKFQRLFICLSQYPDIFSLRSFLHSISRKFPGIEIIIREHPQMRSKLRESLREYVHQIQFSYEQNIQDALSVDTLVLAGNSTVHLEALLCGVPTAYAPNLDLRGAELLPFIKDSLVYTLSELQSFSDKIPQLQAHYENPAWKHQFDGYFHLEESFPQSLSRMESAFRGILAQ